MIRSSLGSAATPFVQAVGRAAVSRHEITHAMDKCALGRHERGSEEQSLRSSVFVREEPARGDLNVT
jgi:hypothetical protein